MVDNQTKSELTDSSIPDGMESMVDQYIRLHQGETKIRKDQYESLVNHYYDLSTDFYEFGWGTSFHFAPRIKGETFRESLLRHQRFLMEKLLLKPGFQAIDLGCGVGGPLGNLVRWSGAHIVGLNNNAKQVERAKANNEDVKELCRFIHADYMKIPEEDESFDAAYAIESMPHAPNKTDAFREALRILRPGSFFAGFDWCLTDHFDPNNPEHMKIKHDIMAGNGLPDISLTTDVNSALTHAGFELIEARDLAPDADSDTPWYRPLQGRDYSLSSIARTPLGRALTNFALRIGEAVRLAPKGSRAVSTFLNAGADALVKGGESDLFTPMYFFLARKPA